MTDLIQGINIPTSEGTDHTSHFMVLDMGDISGGHSPNTIPTATEVTVYKRIPHAPFPATATACATLWLTDSLIITHAMTPTGIVTPHLELTTSPTDATHATSQTRASLAAATPTTLHWKHSPKSQATSKTFNPP